MYAPAPDDERTTLAGYVDQQLGALHASPLGLTEEQARATPCRSTLSLAGIATHVAYVMRSWVTTLTSDPSSPRALDAEAYAAHQASFTLAEGETAADVRAELDALRPELLAAIAATDPGTETLEPPAPWSGVPEPRPARRRYLLVHLVEELARHAGHADILREQLDAMSVPALVMSAAGVPASAFFTPYVPATGTLGATAP